MSRSLILQTAARFLITLMLLFSIFLLLRGHNEPGGGFIGGLVAVGAFALYAIAFGPEAVRTMLRVSPRFLVGVGLTLAVASGLIAAFDGEPFMTGQWIELHPHPETSIKLGTPTLFDVGVYLVVIGFALTIALALEEV
jgi:multicomponent Na+:H+ antiporter subunit B